MSVAVVVNLRAGKGSERVHRLASRHLPQARHVATRDVQELGRFIEDHLAPNPPGVLLSGGGDGTAIRLLDELCARNLELPVLGLLPLGTGNAWAHAVGAPAATKALRRFAEHASAGLPTQRFSLVSVEGRLTPFAGTGWDADIVADYRAQLEATPGPLQPMLKGLRGYWLSLATRTTPKQLFGTRPRVRLINLGEPALYVTARGQVRPLPDGEAGKVLYEGPYGVVGAGTSPTIGFGFQALHLARKVPGRMHVRVYAPGVLEALTKIPALRRGQHPLKHSHDYLLTQCRLEYDRPVPLEIGGDVVGLREQVSFEVAQQTVDVLDWSRLS